MGKGSKRNFLNFRSIEHNTLVKIIARMPKSKIFHSPNWTTVRNYENIFILILILQFKQKFARPFSYFFKICFVKLMQSILYMKHFIFQPKFRLNYLGSFPSTQEWRSENKINFFILQFFS